MLLLEAKIETGRHNLKIKMDNEIIVLQKEINLHVADIKRIQGLISRLALKKGGKNDELRRLKAKSSKTQHLLSDMKKISTTTTKKDTNASPERSLKMTTISGGNTTAGSQLTQ